MTRLLLLPITLPLRIVRVTAERSFDVARGVLGAVLANDERRVADDDIFAPAPSAPQRQPEPKPEAEAQAKPEAIPSLAVLDGEEHLDVEDEIVAESGPERDAGAEIHVGEPWAGYDAMALDEVLARLEDASEAEVAIVRLYERQHENRQAVLLATGEDA